jgi:imidazolonepropionase-like amidohydrolase
MKSLGLRRAARHGAVAAVISSGVAVVLLAQQPTPPTITAFTNVGVVPMDSERILENQTVVVSAGRISALGSAATVAVPPEARKVDGTGKFLIPALAEMHAHIPPGAEVPDATIERTLFMYAANGIGRVRGMLGHERHLAFRRRARDGEIFSPAIVTSGPSFNGNSAPTPEAAVKMVTEQRKGGYDFLKIHPGLSLPTFNALAETADKLRMRFAGHVPAAVGLRRVLLARPATIDHLDGYMEALAGPDAPPAEWFGVNLVDRIDVNRIPELVKATRMATTWMVPTQILLENTIDDSTADELSRRPEMKYASPEQIKAWSENKAKYLQLPSEQRKKFITIRRSLIKAMFDGGVPILLGSDAPQIWNVPGFSAHRELEVLVASGLTPYQALQTGTINVARFLSIADMVGQIVLNRRADVVLVDGNPLIDIRNTAKISGVMLGGRWMDKADIQKRLDSGT